MSLLPGDAAAFGPVAVTINAAVIAGTSSTCTVPT